MFKLKSIKITGFWRTKTASAELMEDVNIIIGRNGTGKTTFMNIIHAVLTVDVEALCDNQFNSVEIALTDGKRTRTIRADRSDPGSSRVPEVVYRISNRRFEVQVFGAEDGRVVPSMFRRRAVEQSQRIKSELSKIVSIASLSVYRIDGTLDPESRERVNGRHASAVDVRLQGLIQRLTQYELELTSSAREISTKLQCDVLTSLLFEEKQDKTRKVSLKFDEKTELEKLTIAYRQLGVSGPEVAKRIREHVTVISAAFKNLALLHKPRTASGEPLKAVEVNFAALEAFHLTGRVVEKSLEAEREIKELFSPLELLLSTLRTFVIDKAFAFNRGSLSVENEGPIAIARLSSGEKQLLILFIEAILQRQRPFIFLADEPELSLHIAWQREILSAIRSLNPNAQIVVATHSPEIAGKFRQRLLDMAEILNA